MDTSLKWTLLHKLLFILILISFLGFIVFLMIIWNRIPDRLPTHYTVGENVAIKYSQKTFVLIPMLMIEGIFAFMITLISFFPSAWTNVSKYLSNESSYNANIKNGKIEKANQMTRTMILYIDLLLINFFNAIHLSAIFQDTFNLPFTLGGFGILLIALILIYTIRLRRTMKGPTH